MPKLKITDQGDYYNVREDTPVKELQVKRIDETYWGLNIGFFADCTGFSETEALSIACALAYTYPDQYSFDLAAYKEQRHANSTGR